MSPSTACHASRTISSSWPLRRLSATLALAGLCIAAGLALLASPASAATCDYVASPSGSDAAPGSAAAPFQTVQHLVERLSSGQTGCLRAGTYRGSVTFARGGAPGAPITLTSYPGDQSAEVIGRMWLAHGADYVTVSSLSLDGANASNLPSPTVDDAHASFIANDVTDDHTAICFNLGDDTGTYGRADYTLIEGNRIHDCGVLPAANHDHGIYVDAANNTQIIGNFIYRNADRGIQLYPDSQGSTIEGNVIDSNGEGIIFSGDFGIASSNNHVENNVITNSSLRDNVESWYPNGNPIGQGNVVSNNCVHGGARDTGDGGVDASAGGFSAVNNLVADPQFVNPSAGNYTLRSSSPCAAILAGSTVPSRSTAPPRRTAEPIVTRHRARASTTAVRGAALTLVASVGRSGARLFVHGRLAARLLSKTRKVLVEVRIGRHWRIIGRRVLTRRSMFALSWRPRWARLLEQTRVRGLIVGIPGEVTVVAHRR